MAKSRSPSVKFDMWTVVSFNSFPDREVEANIRFVHCHGEGERVEFTSPVERLAGRSLRTLATLDVGVLLFLYRLEVIGWACREKEIKINYIYIYIFKILYNYFYKILQ